MSQNDDSPQTITSPPQEEHGFISGTDSLSEQTELEQSRELTPPPLPPRPNLDPIQHRPTISATGSLRLSKKASRPQLLSQATTALSLADVHTQSRIDPANIKSSPASRAASRRQSFSQPSRLASSNNSELDDAGSLRSYAPTLDVRIDGESLLGEIPESEPTPAWKSLSAQVERENPFDAISTGDDLVSLRIQDEFEAMDGADTGDADGEALLEVWKAKLKHFFILSASGKPVYSRHGNDQLISHYIGVVQTIISFFQDTKDSLRCFTAGDTRFVILSKGSLNLAAISRLGESDVQLRNQLEALYMQILSTLTLPNLERIFSSRPSTDLRRPLQGTDVLLDGLADGFTRGSPSSLLSALECLRLRKTHRVTINNTLLNARSQNLLYGLIVAAGRLVSVIRPKKHSLHPGDLHLIFNMLFEAGSVKAGGGENWIPLCLPGFNNTGYLYMYVCFFATSDTGSSPLESERPSSASKDDELAIVFISPNKESFFELRKMRNRLVKKLEENGSIAVIKTAIHRGRTPSSEIVPNSVLRHFLYKSRGNVQFTMPSLEPHFQGIVAKRKLMTLYGSLHDSVHSRTSHLKVLHCRAESAAMLAWETPMFELYCVAVPSASRAALAQVATKVVQWVRREEERVFIIGGAVF